VKNQLAKSNVQIKDAKCLTAQNVSLYANNLIALLTAKLLNLNARLYVKNPSAIGNVINPNAPNLNVNLFVRTLIVLPKLIVVLVLLELQMSLNLSHSSRKLKKILTAVDVLNL
jgi:hypothetical protein